MNPFIHFILFMFISFSYIHCLWIVFFCMHLCAMMILQIKTVWFFFFFLKCVCQNSIEEEERDKGETGDWRKREMIIVVVSYCFCNYSKSTNFKFSKWTSNANYLVMSWSLGDVYKLNARIKFWLKTKKDNTCNMTWG